MKTTVRRFFFFEQPVLALFFAHALRSRSALLPAVTGRRDLVAVVGSRVYVHLVKY